MKLSGNRWAGVLGLILSLFLQGCSGGGESPTDPLVNRDAVLLESILPAAGETLVAGSQVTFRTQARYTLASADAGLIALIIQDQDSRALTASPQQRARITRGEGRVELADTVNIPASGVTSVEVFTALFPVESSSATAVQRVTYTVRPALTGGPAEPEALHRSCLRGRPASGGSGILPAQITSCKSPIHRAKPLAGICLYSLPEEPRQSW